jgi:protein TonB
VSRFTPPPPPVDRPATPAPAEPEALRASAVGVGEKQPPPLTELEREPSTRQPAPDADPRPETGEPPAPRVETAPVAPIPDWSRTAAPFQDGGSVTEGAPAPQPKAATYRAAVAIDRVAPTIPNRLGKRTATSGKVVLQVLVDETGRVVRVVVEQRTTGADLEAAAIGAVLQWRYRPAEQDGAPIRGWVVETFEF